tara:strand:+ start:24017 stop:25420 length:1404 start_codon:yes stop_codon:yes gene_type:complete
MSKRKLLLLSDDIRIPSGVGTMSKELVLGTIHKYDWVQIGGAVKHPDKGKIFDLSKEINEKHGTDDAYCKVYPVDGYGNEQILREVLSIEKGIQGIVHFTDPRFWQWLYNMEHELRQTMPLMYYNIWDDLPYPHWNEPFYESCDLLMAISKQTYGINKNVCVNKPRVEGVDLTYVPHGINEKVYYPIDRSDKEFNEFRNELVRGQDINFIALFNSRNIQRKRTSDLILAYQKFCDKLSKEDAQKCLLVLHTDPVDQAGTDLPAVTNALCDYKVAFSNNKLDMKQLNFLYNCADVTCNPSSAEGFGLSHMESIMTGTPTIATVVGGLQDQMGFQVDGRDLSFEDFTVETPSNSTGDISAEHGSWTWPLWPQMNLQGSPLTPYIYDSRVSIDQITNGLKFWWDNTPEQRLTKGLEGRSWALTRGFSSKGMCEAAINSIDNCFKNFKPRDRYIIKDMTLPNPKINRGVLI